MLGLPSRVFAGVSIWRSVELETSCCAYSDATKFPTSRAVELIPLPGGGAIVDTPGLRELQLWAGAESVDAVFDDVAKIAEGCRFRDCAHAGEPGCAVAEALDAGRLDAGRWESYRKLRAEAAWHETMTDRFAAAERKRKWKAIHKQVRALYRSRE